MRHDENEALKLIGLCFRASRTHFKLEELLSAVRVLIRGRDTQRRRHFYKYIDLQRKSVSKKLFNMKSCRDYYRVSIGLYTGFIEREREIYIYIGIT